MQRIILILVLMILLLNDRHDSRLPMRMMTKPEAMTLVATPVPLDRSDPARRQFGELRYLDGWSLTTNSTTFGGISSLRVTDDGAVTALGDGGEVIMFRSGKSRSRAYLRMVPILPRERRALRSQWDTESMTSDPVTGQFWVGFEATNRICRYSANFARAERCVAPQAVRNWPGKMGMESLTRLPDGRFVAIAEGASGRDGGDHDMLLFAGDPVDPATPQPRLLRYKAPQGYLPTDALAITDDRLLVMNRRITLADGFTGVLTMIDLPDAMSGRVVSGRVLLRLIAPLQHDNFEALAMSREGGAPRLWIASDDNHLFFQRSLLLKFAMPPAWFARRRDGGAPEGGIPPKSIRFPDQP